MVLGVIPQFDYINLIELNLDWLNLFHTNIPESTCLNELYSILNLYKKRLEKTQQTD